MKILRSFAVILCFIIFGIGACFLNFFVFPILKLSLNSEKYAFIASDIIRILWKYFVKFLIFIRLININIKNLDKIKNIKNSIITATHTSFIDVVILISIIPYSTCFIKNSLTKNPIMKNLVNSIFIPNDLKISELLDKSKKYLDLGFNIIIFPSGNRHKINEIPKIKKGASLIAYNFKKNIYPIKIITSDAFLAANTPFYSAGTSVVDFDIELVKTIDINEFLAIDSEIKAKKYLSNEINNLLYG